MQGGGGRSWLNLDKETKVDAILQTGIVALAKRLEE